MDLVYEKNRISVQYGFYYYGVGLKVDGLNIGIIFLIILKVTFLFLISLVNAQNNYPVVFIHGFMGWGPEEMGNYSYWGGKNNYIKELQDDENKIFAMSVGPISSNWDRAVEVFYQLKGGQVDYGALHSEKNDIIRTPKGKKLYRFASSME